MMVTTASFPTVTKESLVARLKENVSGPSIKQSSTVCIVIVRSVVVLSNVRVWLTVL